MDRFRDADRRTEGRPFPRLPPPPVPRAPEGTGFRRALQLLEEGGLVAFPTETVYGLGADGLNASAVAGIYAAKGRPSANPLILHVSGLAMARRLVRHFPLEALALAEAFWPGPLTLVLPKDPCVPDAVTAGGDTVALRMPAHPVALALIRAFGRPLAAPSANRSEHVSPTTATHVADDLAGAVGLILDGGPCERGLESTVLDLSGPEPRILRPGPLPPAALTRVLGRRPALGPGPARAVAPSPGLSPRHYAPRLPVVLAHPAEAELAREPGPQGWLRLGDPPAALPAGVVCRALPAHPDLAARGLYAALRDLETLPLVRIVADLPPDTGPWLALRDRLTRAAAPALAPFAEECL
ncbi:threonylcarbamoyl-AMP synthase [Geothrix rubra]|uniref:Threonylcarbamoyl-AMP synthase n=1 Tax=Geothrix rubra TaxID=2927977 RepID=A0ABQ5Q4Y3_9BACT|nr:L-threonylcarbamoyladenylate synthase [Geothrix rubra]GLH69758.1 threonylcarbamoyl-AMP synthase [Geothrix rubra]